MNAIVIQLETEAILCQELLTANRIIWDKEQHNRSFYEIPGEYSSYRWIDFIAVPTLFASYEKLVSIMKPHGLKVINSEQFSMVYNLESYQTFTKEVYESLYTPEEPSTSYILSQPKDLVKHYRDVLGGLPYLYCYNLRDLALHFRVEDQHKYRHKALLNRLRAKIEEKIATLPIDEVALYMEAMEKHLPTEQVKEMFTFSEEEKKISIPDATIEDELAVYMEALENVFTNEEWEEEEETKEPEVKEEVKEEPKTKSKTKPKTKPEPTQEELYQITRNYVNENEPKISKDIKDAIRKGLISQLTRALNTIMVDVSHDKAIEFPEEVIRLILDEMKSIAPEEKIMKSLKKKVLFKLSD